MKAHPGPAVICSPVHLLEGASYNQEQGLDGLGIDSMSVPQPKDPILECHMGLWKGHLGNGVC